MDDGLREHIYRWFLLTLNSLEKSAAVSRHVQRRRELELVARARTPFMPRNPIIVLEGCEELQRARDIAE